MYMHIFWKTIIRCSFQSGTWQYACPKAAPNAYKKVVVHGNFSRQKATSSGQSLYVVKLRSIFHYAHFQLLMHECLTVYSFIVDFLLCRCLVSLCFVYLSCYMCIYLFIYIFIYLFIDAKDLIIETIVFLHTESWQKTK